MGTTIKGLTVEINGETTGLQSALKDVGKAANDINKELGLVEKGLKFDPSNTVLLGQKHELLEKKIAETRKALDLLRQAQDKVEAMYKAGEIDDGQYRAFRRELEITESKLKTFEGQVKGVESAQDSAGRSTDGWGDKLKGMAGKLGAAAAAAGTALIAMGTQAVSNAGDIQEMADKTGISAERLQELGYAAADLGVDMDTVASSQAKLTKNMDAARNGTGQAGDAFKALGINVTDSNGNLRDAREVMFEAFDALGKVGNETERDALAMKIFGRSAQELNPLIDAGSATLADLAQQARDSGAVMSNDAVAGLDAFGDGMDHMKTAILTTIGQAFAKIMPVVQPILDALLSAPGPIKIIIGVIAALGVGLMALSPVLIALTAVEWAAMAPLLPLIGIVAAVIAGIAALVAIVIVCIKYWDEIKAAFVTAWEAIVAAFTAAWEAIKGAWDAIVEWLGGLKDAIVGFFAGAGEWLLEHGRAIITGAWDGMKAIWQSLSEWGSQIITWVKDFFRGAGEWLFELGRDTITGAWSGMKAIWSEVSGWGSKIVGWVKDFFSGAIEWLLELGKDIFRGLWNGLKWLWDVEITGWMNIGTKIKDFFSGAGSWLLETGKDILRGLWNGLKNVWESVKSWFLDKISWLNKILPEKYEIHSPSQVFFRYGKAIMQGFGLGMEGSFADAVNPMQHLTAALSSVGRSSGAGAGNTSTTTQTTATYNNQRSIVIPVSGNDGLSVGRQIATILGGI